MNRRRLLIQGNILKGAVDLGLPSGTLWAQGNIVKNGDKYGIGEETDYGAYFSWGNVVGHNDSEGYNFDKTTYNSTAGASLTANIASNDATHDAALALLGTPWHLPTKLDFQELYLYTDTTITKINGVKGWKFMKKSDHSVYIFFPYAGSVYYTSIGGMNAFGVYWSSTLVEDRPSYAAYFLYIDYMEVNPQNDESERFEGYTIRPIISGGVN